MSAELMGWGARFAEGVVMDLCDELEKHEQAENGDDLYDAINEAIWFDLENVVAEAIATAKRMRAEE